MATSAGRTPEIKGAISNVTRVANEALDTAGMNSAALDFFGHPFLRPLGEPYFSQVPMRYGDYIAKLCVTPYGPELKAVWNQKIELRTLMDSARS